jgi:cholesterol transport system auxiliary component
MKRLIGYSVLVLLTACGGQPAPDLYTLRAADSSESAACVSRSTIRIGEPVTGPGLDSAHIVVDAGGKQTFYRGVRWNAPTAPMLQHYLADAFEGSQLFATVTTEDSTIHTQWELESELRAFEVDQSSGTPQVVIRLTATLVDTATHTPVLSIPLQSRQDVGGQNMAGIAQSFNDQMDTLTARLLQKIRPRLRSCR